MQWAIFHIIVIAPEQHGQYSGSSSSHPEQHGQSSSYYAEQHGQYSKSSSSFAGQRGFMVST